MVMRMPCLKMCRLLSSLAGYRKIVPMGVALDVPGGKDPFFRQNFLPTGIRYGELLHGTSVL